MVKNHLRRRKPIHLWHLQIHYHKLVHGISTLLILTPIIIQAEVPIHSLLTIGCLIRQYSTSFIVLLAAYTQLHLVWIINIVLETLIIIKNEIWHILLK